MDTEVRGGLKAFVVVALALFLAVAILMLARPAEAATIQSGQLKGVTTRTSTTFRGTITAGYSWDTLEYGYMTFYDGGRQVGFTSCPRQRTCSDARPARGDVPCWNYVVYYNARNTAGYSIVGSRNAC